jgi:hypothetical protein
MLKFASIWLRLDEVRYSLHSGHIGDRRIPSRRAERRPGRNGATLDVPRDRCEAALDRAFMIKPCKTSVETPRLVNRKGLRSERGRSGSCGALTDIRQSQLRKTLVPLVRTSDGPRRLILDSGLHTLCKCQMLLQDWQCASNNSFNRPSLRLALRI